ncbi:hypothetical protein CPB85DRAFT_1529674 [Mucidula mucida]|nr:hypothetical protein CPB85DRAFT_1529674 [Mucidula mucida]
MHLPCSVFSHKQLDLFLWLLSANSVPDVPSVKSMQTLNKHLQKLCGIESIRYDGALGHVYYVNSLADIIAQEMANPNVRPHLHFFPEDAGEHVSEAQHASQWLHELPDDQLTAMVRVGRRDFYIHEPTRLKNGLYCMPVRFFMKDRSLRETRGPHGRAWSVHKVNDFEVPVSDFMMPLPQLQKDIRILDIPDPADILSEPWTLTNLVKGNRWCELAEGHRVIAFPIWMYYDDTLGNKSKKWNKHNSFLFTPAGLPRSEAQKEYNMHFLSTLNLAPPLEMLDGIADQLEAAEKEGIWAWDCVENEPVLVLPVSEFACHIGLRGKLFCWICKVVGKDASDTPWGAAPGDVDEGEEVEDDASMNSNVSGASNKGKRKKFVKSLEQMVRRVTAFIKTRVKKMRTDTGVKDTFQLYFQDLLAASYKKKRGNESRQAALDAAIEALSEHVTSPVWCIKGDEILHVVLLGFVKYFWRDLIQNQLKKDDQKDALGLSPLPGDTFVKYAGSLVGRNFCAIAQVAPYVIYNLVNDECRATWVALSKLIPLVWQPQIGDISTYTKTLKNEIQTFLLAAAQWTNRWFNKPKFHILVHLPAHIRCFGPAMLFATEAFESFNVVIRAKSIHSNRQAPSRDIAHGFAQGNRIRHLLSGGLFQLLQTRIPGSAPNLPVPTCAETFSKCRKDWVLVGGGSQEFMNTPGPVMEKAGQPVFAKSTLTAQHVPDALGLNVPSVQRPFSSCCFKQATLVRLLNGNDCRCDDFVIVRRIPGFSTFVGCIREVLTSVGALCDTPDFILIEECEVSEQVELAKTYGMPAVRPSGVCNLVQLESILCTVNVQHNCASEKCTATGEVEVLEEHEKTTKTCARVLHNDLEANLMLNTA